MLAKAPLTAASANLNLGTQGPSLSEVARFIHVISTTCVHSEHSDKVLLVPCHSLLRRVSVAQRPGADDSDPSGLGGTQTLAPDTAPGGRGPRIGGRSSRTQAQCQCPPGLPDWISLCHTWPGVHSGWLARWQSPQRRTRCRTTSTFTALECSLRVGWSLLVLAIVPILRKVPKLTVTSDIQESSSCTAVGV